MHTLTLSLPAHRDLAQPCIVICLNPLQIAHYRRRDDDLFRRFARQVDLDPCKVSVKPDLRMAEHEMVLRMARVGVPGFSEGCRALLELIAVAGRVGAREHVVEDIGSAGLTERIDDVPESDIAGGDGVGMSANVVHQLLKYRIPVLRFDNS